MACRDCLTGYIKIDQPTGRVETVHGRLTYIAEPPGNATPKGLIIIIPDGGGMPGPNSRLLADVYAKKGCFRVYLPDFHDGHVIPTWMPGTVDRFMATGTLIDWIMKPYDVACMIYATVPFLWWNGFATSIPKVSSFFAAVRNDDNQTLPVGVAGFCWGGQHTVHLAHGMKSDSGHDLIDAAFTAHPASLKIPGDIKQIIKPISFAVGDQDMLLPVKQVEELEAAIRSIPDLKNEVVLYPGAGHGFALRAKPDDKKIMQQAVECEDQAVKWFTERFAEL